MEGDSFGRRIQKSSAAGITNYLYDSSNSVEEIDSTGAVLARYSQTTGIDEPLAELRGGTTGFYEQDGLGSVTSLSDPTAALANTYTYDAFGNLTVSTGALANPFQYTGRDYDSETGLRYYRARYYDSIIGRFVSADPLEFSGGDENFYAYVGNSPANYIDPSGLLRFHRYHCNPFTGHCYKNPSPDPYPTRLFGTHWCGPGGAGQPLSALDAACKAHDECYDANGLTISDNWPTSAEALDQLRASGKLAALQKCNKNLCDAAKKIKGIRAWLVWAYFYEFGAGDVDSQMHPPDPHPRPWDWRHPL